jgi:hypothetical protein
MPPSLPASSFAWAPQPSFQQRHGALHLGTYALPLKRNLQEREPVDFGLKLDPADTRSLKSLMKAWQQNRGKEDRFVEGSVGPLTCPDLNHRWKMLSTIVQKIGSEQAIVAWRPLTHEVLGLIRFKSAPQEVFIEHVLSCTERLKGVGPTLISLAAMCHPHINGSVSSYNQPPHTLKLNAVTDPPYVIPFYESLGFTKQVTNSKQASPVPMRAPTATFYDAIKQKGILIEEDYATCLSLPQTDSLPRCSFDQLKLMTVNPKPPRG